ncbi:putative mfs-multidrug-resistance transporter [Moniliophthora roreri]|nr:putative mfs-multidrug-resistance transporter [Moniliophthora roreri]
MIIFTMLETYYMPILLVRRAQQLRKETGDNGYYVPMEATKKALSQRFAWKSQFLVCMDLVSFSITLGTNYELGLLNYLIDTYLAFAASDLAVAAVLRSFFGATIPLFAHQMYDALNPRWASTLHGFVALAMTLIPFVFLKSGAQLRKRSKLLPPVPPLPSRWVVFRQEWNSRANR